MKDDFIVWLIKQLNALPRRGQEVKYFITNFKTQRKLKIPKWQGWLRGIPIALEPGNKEYMFFANIRSGANIVTEDWYARFAH